MAGYGVVGYVGMKCRKLAVWGGVGMWMWCCVGCVRFGCEGLVVFWGGCVVFWCSFWVGFWLSESLRVCSRLLEMADVSAEAKLPPNAEANASALHLSSQT
jgi:hypothetical protein